MIFFHQGGQVIGGQIVNRQPYDQDDEPDDEDMYSQKLPEETVGQA